MQRGSADEGPRAATSAAVQRRESDKVAQLLAADLLVGGRRTTAADVVALEVLVGVPTDNLLTTATDDGTARCQTL